MMKSVAIPRNILLGSMILLLICLLSPAVAALVTLPSGQKFDLSQDQLERIKARPGVFYVQHPKENIIPLKLTDSTVIDIPDILGGGFLMGRAQRIENAFADLLIQDTPEASNNPSPDATHGKTTARTRSNFQLTTDYRVDELNWSIAGNSSGNSPNILSELTWEDIEIFQLKLANRTVFKNHLFIKSVLSYGWIYDGRNQDSDYACDDRNCEFSRSNNNTSGDNVWDLSLGLGPQFTFGLDFLELSPILGYSYHRQRLNITDGFQTIPSSGSFEGLDSTYEATWHGPWVGLDLKIHAMQPLGIFTDVAFLFSLEYHLGFFYAQADWNLREDFSHPKSFEQDAIAQGFLLSMGSELHFNNHWALLANFSYNKWQTNSGTDRIFFADGTSAETRLNEANWRYYAFSLGFCYRF